MDCNLNSAIKLLTKESRDVLDYAVKFATSNNHSEVTPEHLLYFLIQKYGDVFSSLCTGSGLNVEELFCSLDEILTTKQENTKLMLSFSTQLEEWLVKSMTLANMRWNQNQIDVVVLISYLLNESHISIFTKKIQSLIKCNFLKAQQILQENYCMNEVRDFSSDEVPESAIETYTKNISELARNGKLDPVLGRNLEVRQIIDILLRRRQNNPILVGEPGVGKTALVEGLALRIAESKVPTALSTMEILTLDISKMQAGASVKGEFDKRVQSLLKEVTSSKRNILLFIDEAHMLIGAGGQPGQNDAANLLKPALSRGELKVIAATTWAEYKKYFEKDTALARRFQLVKVEEPNIENATIMLRAVAPHISHHHGVPILESAIYAAVRLSSRYITNRQLPDKSICLLDTACARVAVSQVNEPKELETLKMELLAVTCECDALTFENSNPERLTILLHKKHSIQGMIDTLHVEWERQKSFVQSLLKTTDNVKLKKGRQTLSDWHRLYPMVFESVDDICIADVVSEWTGVPLGHMLVKESEKFDNVFIRLAEKIKGQPIALEHISRQLMINNSGMADPTKPTGVYLFAGPSGTGKTETAITIAEQIYGHKNNFISINMSEYQESHSVSGLKGAPPGYLGYGQGGILTEAVRRNPYSVILLDEIEKAHPDVLELFYQIFDRGFIEDAEGQHINFRNSLIIMTSNLGSFPLMEVARDETNNYKKLCDLIRPECEKVLSPALMGRLTLIPYVALTSSILSEIAQLKIHKLCLRFSQIKDGNIYPAVSKKVIPWILEMCHVKQSGARDVEHVLNDSLLPLLSKHMLSGNAQPFTIDVSNSKLILRKSKDRK